jgi:hypothetical protein
MEAYPQAVSPLLRGCLRRVETMSKRNRQAKLTSAIVETIRNAKERRGIVTALAIQYGVSHSMISMIRAGKRWTEDQMNEERFKPDRLYAMHGSVLNAIWRDIYLPLITDDGTPMMAIKGDCRRDMAQRLGALLESNAIEMEAK